MKPAGTIAEALEKLNGRFGMIVTVLDEDQKLCGIASEGNLRRAILNGNPLSTPLERVANREFISLQERDLDDQVECLKVIDQISHKYASGAGQQATIPVVDGENKVIGLVTPEILQSRGDEGHTNGNKFAGPHVLVVGGAGYVGSMLVRMLLDRGWRVRVLDNMLYNQNSLSGIDNPHFSLVKGDVTNLNDVVEAIEGIDAVVYLAEIVGDAACAYRPQRTLKTNYLAVTNMAHLCAYLNINRFVYTSSCSVYGGSKDPLQLLSEDSQVNPVSYYGRMKTMAEQALLGIASPLFAPTILRLATVFGYSYRPRFDLVVNAFTKNAYFKKEIEVFGGDQWRPNVHVKDVALSIIKVLEAPLENVSRQIFNVGANSENYRIRDIARLVKDIFPEITVTQNTLSQDARNYRVDCSKIKSHLAFQPSFGVAQGIGELKEIFEHKKVIDPDNTAYSNIRALQEFDNSMVRS